MAEDDFDYDKKPRQWTQISLLNGLHLTEEELDEMTRVAEEWLDKNIGDGTISKSDDKQKVQAYVDKQFQPRFQSYFDHAREGSIYAQEAPHGLVKWA